MTPKYHSPGRRETSRTAQENAAMAIPGRFKADGCFVEVRAATPKAPALYAQVNRKYRRSGGRSS